MIDFELWKKVLMNLVETFKEQEKKADFTQGFAHIVIAGLIVGFFAGIGSMIGLTAVGAMGGVTAGAMGTGVGAMAFVVSLVVTPITSVIGWLIGSAIIYVFAMLFGGKGDFVKQSYLIALYAAPLMVVSSIVSLIPFVGPILSLLVSLYGIYLLTMSIKQAHKVSTGKAIAIWLVPVVIVAVLVSVLAVGFLMTMLPMMGQIS